MFGIFRAKNDLKLLLLFMRVEKSRSASAEMEQNAEKLKIFSSRSENRESALLAYENCSENN
jgi:hypothetical protein